MRREPNNQQPAMDRIRIGYIASHLYRLTFEINEVVELLRQRPDTRIYSFYRPRGSEGIQSERLKEIPAAIIAPSWGSVLGGLCRLCVGAPGALVKGAALLMWNSKSNPVYWFKNLVVFFVALPILADARRHKVTHLHADFGSSPATIAWLGKKMLGTSMSIRYHSFDIHLNTIGWRDPLRLRKLRDADVVFAVHHDGLGFLKRRVPDIGAEKFKVVRVCVMFDPLPKRGELPERPLVIAAGNLVPAKGFDTLVDAIGVLKRRGVTIRLRILGEGPERAYLESLVEKNGIGDRVEMPGFYQHAGLAPHLAEAVALVVPPRITKVGLREGLPTVIVEAWLSKTPVIVSPVGGIPEVVEDERTGLVFAPGDAEALADCIERLVEQPELAARLAENGRVTAHDVFSPEKNVRALIDEIVAMCE
jgi:colanic acid/amylovoran biosynthesis glycosyltransferase